MAAEGPLPKGAAAGAPSRAVDSDGPGEERAVPLCPDQADWLTGLAERYGLRGESQWRALESLVQLANREPPQSKRMIFLVVRCHRCLQHTRGGEKRDCLVTLPGQQWQWLEGVRERCKHLTIGKTLRIIVDFYRPILDKDPDFERDVFAPIVPMPARAEAPSASLAAQAKPDSALSVASEASMGG